MPGQIIELAVSMGDPAGIGAEVILAALPDVPENVRVTIYGDAGAFRDAASILAKSGARGPEKDIEIEFESLSVLSASEREFGKPSALTGEASYRYAVAAAKDVMEGKADALVTAPISKKWIRAAGHNFTGHTELLAQMTGANRFAMMLAGPDLRVVTVTTHIPLADVPGALNTQAIVDSIELTRDGLIEYFDVAAPRIAVAGLNPHAGESGEVGREEIEIIAPAVELARESGIDAIGPLPADAAFAKRRDYDAIVCMFHDQAMAPIKTLYFDRAVNLTLGLPIVRTSPDHGTAFDIAGKAAADPSSMLAAMLLAADIAGRKAGKSKN